MSRITRRLKDWLSLTASASAWSRFNRMNKMKHRMKYKMNNRSFGECCWAALDDTHSDSYGEFHANWTLIRHNLIDRHYWLREAPVTGSLVQFAHSFIGWVVAAWQAAGSPMATGQTPGASGSRALRWIRSIIWSRKHPLDCQAEPSRTALGFSDLAKIIRESFEFLSISRWKL